MAEVQIIRICKLSLCALLLAGTAGSPAFASRGDSASELNRYVEARLAESSREMQTAAAIYAESLKEQPDNALVVGKAYVSAIEAGDFDLAAKAVRIMRSRGVADPEMPLFTFAEAFNTRDWNGASVAIQELKTLKNFAFMQPFLDAWIETARGQDATASLALAKANTTARYYLEDQLILSKLASREEDQAVGLLVGLVQRDDSRSRPLRMIAARHFWAIDDPATAKDILKSQSSEPEQKLLRQIESGQKRGVAQKVTAPIGLAFLFQRLSRDLAAQRAQFPAQVMAEIGSQIAGDSDYAHLTLGLTYAAADKYELAVAELEQLSVSSPYYLTGFRSLIASLVTGKQYEQAIMRLDAALQNDPDIPELHLLKGQALQAKGESKAAAESFETAVSMGQKLNQSKIQMANYWLALGGAQEQAGIWPEALQSLQKANELLPNSPSILNYLGYAQLERRENKQAAIAAIKQAHELRSTSPAITDSLGWAYFITGDLDRAVTYLESALEGEPKDPTINEHLGDAYWTVGRLYEARYAWKSAELFAEDQDRQRLARKIDLGLRPDLVSP